jgi:RNA polymerase sigma-70 factor (ECF subfamily)
MAMTSNRWSSKTTRQLYRFALNLTRSEAAAADLTQRAFTIWAQKGRALSDASETKNWLFTTLYREFLTGTPCQHRLPHEDVDSAALDELPVIEPAIVETLGARHVVEALGCLDAIYQTPLALFYLDGFSYQDVAETLEIPIDMARSRIARGKTKLHSLLMARRS